MDIGLNQTEDTNIDLHFQTTLNALAVLENVPKKYHL